MNQKKSILLIILAPILTLIVTGSNISSIVGGLIVEDITLNVPEDYSDIQTALHHLADKRIDKDVYVTIQVSDGNYTDYSSVYVSHPDGNRLKIIGNPSSPSSVVIVFSSNQIGLKCDSGSVLGYLDGFTLTSDGSGTGILANKNSHIEIGDNLIIDNFSVGLNAAWGSTILCGSITVKNNGVHGVLAHNASINLKGSYVHNNGNGVLANAYSFIQFENGRSENNSKGVISWRGSYIDKTGTIISGNSTNTETQYSGIISD